MISNETIIFISIAGIIISLIFIVVKNSGPQPKKIRIDGATYCKKCKNTTGIINSSQVRDYSYIISYQCSHCGNSGSHCETNGWNQSDFPKVSNPSPAKWE